MHECMDDGDSVSATLRGDDDDSIAVMPDRGYRGDGGVNREDDINVVNVEENNLMINNRMMNYGE